MRQSRKQERETQTRLLESACEIFAKKGYRDATIAEICERAGANIAAANYYFGDKQTLYSEAWRLSFQRSLKTYPPYRDNQPDVSAEDRLYSRILSILRRIADPESLDFDIMFKELASPTGLLAEVIQETIEPIRQEFFVLLRELLGENASDLQIQLCQMSIRAQCFDLILRERRRNTVTDNPSIRGLSLIDLDIEKLANHICRFSLAGIREIRQEIETGTSNEGKTIPS
jgi:AcrR family transcriptional regulator